MKARIAQHGNENFLKDELSKDCTICPPTGVIILECIPLLYGWVMYRADDTAAFLHTSNAQRDVYFKPPRESKITSTHYWLLPTAAYGLLNDSPKLQNQADLKIIDYVFTQCRSFSQLFYKYSNTEKLLVVTKPCAK